MKEKTRLRLEAEKRKADEIANRENFEERALAFRLELQALCIKYRVDLVPFANPSNNVHCDPEIEIMQLGLGEIPALVDKGFDPKPEAEVYVPEEDDDD
jgi:hypothetical protein